MRGLLARNQCFASAVHISKILIHHLFVLTTFAVKILGIEIVFLIADIILVYSEKFSTDSNKILSIKYAKIRRTFECLCVSLVLKFSQL